MFLAFVLFPVSNCKPVPLNFFSKSWRVPGNESQASGRRTALWFGAAPQGFRFSLRDFSTLVPIRMEFRWQPWPLWTAWPNWWPGCDVRLHMLCPWPRNGVSENDLSCYLWHLCLANQGTLCVWVTKTFGTDTTWCSALVKLLLVTSSVLHVAMLKSPKGKNVSWVSRWCFAIS